MFEEITIQTLTRIARERIMLIARSVDAVETNFQTELDLLDILLLTEVVICDRLLKPGVTTPEQTLVEAGHFEERKRDSENNFTLLFNSIRLDVEETIRTTYANPIDGRARGSVIQKYTTLGLDAIFAVLCVIGPHRSSKFTTLLVKSFQRDIMGLGEVDEMDSKVATTTLSTLSKQRAQRNRKPLTYAQRMTAIASAVESLQS
jgi:hypothetical protein